MTKFHSNTNSPAILAINGLHKTFGSADRLYKALVDINLTVTRGEFIAIVGRSGSGKSTLLNMIAGLDTPSNGDVLFQGQALHRLSENERARWRGQHVGIVFQFFQLIPTLSILENLLLAMSFVNVVPHEQRYPRAVSLLTEVGLLNHLHKLPSALSGGEQQRAAIARALANDPQILIADEPTGNLDQHTADQINALLASLTKQGKTVLVVTHDRDRDDQYDRVIELRDGQIVGASRTQKVA